MAIPRYAGIYNGVTKKKGKRRVFNGNATVALKGHPLWSKPLRLPPAKEPKLGPGKPSLIFVQDMGELFYEKHAVAHISLVCETIALSDHIGLLLTKRTGRMAEFLLKQSPLTVRQWQKKLWLGFSAERQQEVDNPRTSRQRMVCLGQHRTDAEAGDITRRIPRAREAHVGHRWGSHGPEGALSRDGPGVGVCDP